MKTVWIYVDTRWLPVINLLALGLQLLRAFFVASINAFDDGGMPQRAVVTALPAGPDDRGFVVGKRRRASSRGLHMIRSLQQCDESVASWLSVAAGRRPARLAQRSRLATRALYF
jgi:hypothetical protein